MCLKITEWAAEDRPREKLVLKGAESLSDAELLGILISSGTKEMSAVDLGRELLGSAGNSLNALGRMSVSDIKKIRGIGTARAVTVIAALELGRRRKQAGAPDLQKINGSKDVAAIFQPMLGDLWHEEFWILFLNRSNGITGRARLSQGGVSGTVTDVRLIMKRAIEHLASAIVVCHNHPSGNVGPSEQDIRITRKIGEACKLMDILLADHLIVTGKDYYSFADNGMIRAGLLVAYK
ncbi:MAG: DNA repair protein RadC [Bacteroidales bacterium]|jgi:DNA repair protein RadC|nr:DNA repair protein RadC [Bacteroidales bacterium]